MGHFYTDFIQFWIMLLIFIILVPLGLMHIGGISAFSKLTETHFNLFTYGGPTLFFGAILLGIIYPLLKHGFSLPLVDE